MHQRSHRRENQQSRQRDRRGTQMIPEFIVFGYGRVVEQTDGGVELASERTTVHIIPDAVLGHEGKLVLDAVAAADVRVCDGEVGVLEDATGGVEVGSILVVLIQYHTGGCGREMGQVSLERSNRSSDIGWRFEGGLSLRVRLVRR